LLFRVRAKVLLAHPACANLNLNALRQYLSFDYVPAPLSIYEGISKLPAAHMLTLEDGQVRLSATGNSATKRVNRRRASTKPRASARVAG